MSEYPLPNASTDLTGRVALVTGASSGLGARFAEDPKAKRRPLDEAAFRKLFEAEEAVGLAVLDTEGRIRFANAALARLCGDEVAAVVA